MLATAVAKIKETDGAYPNLLPQGHAENMNEE